MPTDIAFILVYMAATGVGAGIVLETNEDAGPFAAFLIGATWPVLIVAVAVAVAIGIVPVTTCWLTSS